MQLDIFTPFIQIVSARGRARSFVEELRFSYRAHSSSSSVCFTSTGENPLSSLPQTSVDLSQKAHGCHGKITRFQIIVSLGATKIRMTRIMNPILDSPQNTPHPQIPKYAIALTASAGILLFFVFLNLSVNTFCSKRTIFVSHHSNSPQQKVHKEIHFDSVCLCVFRAVKAT